MCRLNKGILILTIVAWIASIGLWTAHAENRGIAVKIRAEDSISAPVTETLQLYDKSYALVIGIDKYTNGWPPLHNAVSDAQEVATELKNRGFEVTFKKNTQSSELQQSLKKFFAIQGSDPEARLLLWYAGHGHTIKGEGFLVPADAPQPISPEFKLKAVHMRDFGGFMRLAESKHVFAIFDSCFAGTIFEARAGAVPAAITRVTTLPVRQFISSGDANQTVSDDGAFRKFFLRGIRGEERADANGDGYITASEMGLYLFDRVTNLTEQAQTPRYGKLRDPDFDRGDFVFLLPGHPAPENEAKRLPADVPTGQEAMVEITLWASVAASENPADFESYLQKYPNGNFA
ncbi:MAG: caspase family protein, partial [Proteobacteria bacterium]|nr:caspase family protein [Pseudomonadota bacterium]